MCGYEILAGSDLFASFLFAELEFAHCLLKVGYKKRLYFLMPVVRML